jgi:glycosyltransferase involved in cell wall biosynthesis
MVVYKDQLIYEFEQETQTRPLVSVVVPTYQRPAYLRRCLTALLAQDMNPADYEIIVADNAACAETKRLVEMAAARGNGMTPAVRYLAAHARPGPAAARNRGIEAARAAVIAFTDDDCVPRPDWLRRGLARLAEGYLAVAGQVDVPLPNEPTDYERNAAGIAGIQFLTANCFYRREALAAVGGFDERFAQAWREDSDLFFTLLEWLADHPDGRYAHAPDAVVVHPVRPARWGASIQQQRKSLYNALLYKKHPTLYRSLIQPRPPWHYYQIIVALLALLAGVATGRWRLAGGAGAVWAVLTGRFCARRLRGTSHAPAHLAEMVLTSAVIPPLAIYWRLYGALKYRVWFF